MCLIKRHLQSKPKAARSSLFQNKTAFAYFLLTPQVIILLVFMVFPILSSLAISFTGLDFARPKIGMPFVGLDNYIKAVTSKNFLESIQRTIYFTGMSVSLTIIMGLGFASALTKPAPGVKFIRAIIIIPWAVPAVISGLMWRWIFNAQWGPLNGILMQLGIIDSYQSYLSRPFLALNVIVLANLWKQVPFAVLMCIAALSTIPEDLFEAAKVDGANPLQAFWSITLPLIMPSLAVLMVLSTAWSFFAFDLVYAITEGGPANATTILPYFAYLRIFKFLKFGEGAAIGYIITLVVLILGYLYMKLIYREVKY